MDTSTVGGLRSKSNDKERGTYAEGGETNSLLWRAEETLGVAFFLEDFIIIWILDCTSYSRFKVGIQILHVQFVSTLVFLRSIL